MPSMHSWKLSGHKDSYIMENLLPYSVSLRLPAEIHYLIWLRRAKSFVKLFRAQHTTCPWIRFILKNFLNPMTKVKILPWEKTKPMTSLANKTCHNICKKRWQKAQIKACHSACLINGKRQLKRDHLICHRVGTFTF